MERKFLVFAFFLFIALHTQAQLYVDTTATATQLAQKLVGAGTHLLTICQRQIH